MGEVPEVSDPKGERLESWKEIASYLRRSERTVRRWEEREGLPVHRLQHDKRGSVFAYAAELDAWRESRQPDESDDNPEDLPRRMPRWVPLAGGVIAAALVGLLIVERAGTTSERTPNPAAVRALQQGQFGQNASRTQIAAGIRYATEAVRLDSEYARAWATLAMAHVAQTWFDETRAIESMNEARKEAERARQLDPSSPGAQLALGWVTHYLDWDHQASERHFRRAIELVPAAAVAHSWFGDVLLNQRRFDEALRSYQAAQNADPRWLEPIALAGQLHAIRGNTEVAVAEIRRALEVDPNHGLAIHLLGRAYLVRGELEQAIATLRKSNDMMERVPFSMADLGYALAVGGARDEAERMLADMRTARASGYYPAFALATIETGLGRTDEALDWLEQAAEERHLGLYMPTVDPIYTQLYTNPRFVAFAARIHLPVH